MTTSSSNPQTTQSSEDFETLVSRVKVCHYHKCGHTTETCLTVPGSHDAVPPQEVFDRIDTGCIDCYEIEAAGLRVTVPFMPAMERLVDGYESIMKLDSKASIEVRRVAGTGVLGSKAYRHTRTHGSAIASAEPTDLWRWIKQRLDSRARRFGVH